MKALLLAAGKGERFYPFNRYKSKSMFPVCNRPLLAWLVDRVVSVGLDEIGIVVGWQDGSIRSYFGDGSRFGCSITYIDQPEPNGTAEAVVRARGFVGEDPVLIMLGDLILPPDALPSVLASYQKNQNFGVAATIKVDRISEHTSVNIGPDGQMIDYFWKPRGGAGTALAGIYAIPGQTVSDLENVSNVVRTQFGIAPHEGKEIENVIPILYRDRRALREVQIDGPVLDMDYPWQPNTFGDRLVHDLGTALTESHIADTARVDPDAHIDGPIFIDDHAVVDRDVYIKGPVWIGKDTHITEGSHLSSYTIIGDSCHIGPFAKVSGYVGNDCRITYLGEFSGTMLDGGRVTHQIQLSGVFGMGAEIGAGTQCGTLRFDDAPVQVEVNGQRREAEGFSGVLFGDYSRTGVGALMMPGRIIGPCSMVGAGVVLMRNLPANKAILVKQETETIDWSPEIYNR
ncbi:MAG: sugar phosphate nucleotidyltransferase [Candidatus Latescibacterota bacterium]|nr:sugar phosphate nucleotidyltransferase [Candidatus Latescibacterota bacterium]